MTYTSQQNPDPMFGRPTWSYLNVQRGPVRGPQPRLAIGSGKTTDQQDQATGGNLPGYLSDNTYDPSTFEYAPPNRISFEAQIPRTIMTGDDGRSVVGTYQPHDITPGQRFIHQLRSPSNWQIMEYPPDFRNMLAWQQVQKYRVRSITLQAQPLPRSNYFLGYMVDPRIAQALGQTTMGQLGSV